MSNRVLQSILHIIIFLGITSTMVLTPGEVKAQSDPVLAAFTGCGAITFDTSAENFRTASTNTNRTIKSGPFDAPYTSGTNYFRWEATGGTPDGHIRVDDLDSGWQELWTPVLSDPDFSSLLGQQIQFSYRNDTGYNQYRLYVLVRSNSGTEYYFYFNDQLGSPGSWSRVNIPMIASYWHTGFESLEDPDTGPADTPAPSDAQFSAVLSDLDRIAISVEGVSGADTSRFDSFGRSCDFGDLPESGTSFVTTGSDAPRHNTSSDLLLGSIIDPEPDGHPSPLADGDDLDISDDEDGIIAFLPLPIGAPANYSVNLSVKNVTGKAATLLGWIDFDNDGVLETSEVASASVPGNGTVTSSTLNWVGVSAADQQLFGRFRISTFAYPTDDPATDLDERSQGRVSDGEVEDYLIDATPPTITSTSLVPLYAQNGPATFDLVFSEEMNNPAGDSGSTDVTNPANYLLVEEGSNGSFDTINCAGGLQADDQGITINSVSFSGITATINISSPPAGNYKLFACGTTLQDLVGNQLNGGTDFTYTFTVDDTYPTVTSTTLVAIYGPTGPTSFDVTYSEDVDDPPGDSGTDDVTNPANYLLVEQGANGSLDTASCSSGLGGDDLGIVVDSVSYASGTQTATVNINGSVPLTDGTYQLFVCGSTSIVDQSGNALNNGSDYTTSFVVDGTSPDVTVEQASSQADPTNQQPINFTVTFNEPIATATFTAGDLSFGGTAPGSATAVISEITPNDSTTFNVAVSGLTGDGTITITILAGGVEDPAGNTNTPSSSTDNQVTYDISAPTVSSTNLASSYLTGPAGFTATFSEDMQPSVAASTSNYLLVEIGPDFVFDTTSCQVGLTPDDTQFSVDSVSYDVASRTATVTINGGTPLPVGTYQLLICEDHQDLAGNYLNDGNDFKDIFIVGSEYPVVVSTTLNPGYNPTGPTSYSFTFSLAMQEPGIEEPTSYLLVEAGFDQILDTTSCAGGIGGDDQQIIINSVSYTPGTLTATLSVNGGVGLPVGSYRAFVCSTVEQDVAGNKLNGGVIDYNYDFLVDATYPVITSTSLKASYPGKGPASIEIRFSEDMYDPIGDLRPDDVTNPLNYLLVESGDNATFDTLSCLGGVQTDDLQITIDNVSYNSTTMTATLSVNGGSALPLGSYQLMACGTTSLVDLARNPISNGTDYLTSFVVLRLPDTGFPQGISPSLHQFQGQRSDGSSLLMLEIPSLDLEIPIVGIPQTEKSWDVSWLGSSAGWLPGSAFPTWAGNTVITAHVWDENNLPGPFAGLKDLRYGEVIYIHAFGQTYAYQILENRLVSRDSIERVFQHEDMDWVTLVTCEGYDPYQMDYANRRLVRAVLVAVR